MAGLRTQFRIKHLLYPGTLTEKTGYRRIFRWSVMFGMLGYAWFFKGWREMRLKSVDMAYAPVMNATTVQYINPDSTRPLQPYRNSLDHSYNKPHITEPVHRGDEFYPFRDWTWDEQDYAADLYLQAYVENFEDQLATFKDGLMFNQAYEFAFRWPDIRYKERRDEEHLKEWWFMLDSVIRDEVFVRELKQMVDAGNVNWHPVGDKDPTGRINYTTWIPNLSLWGRYIDDMQDQNMVDAFSVPHFQSLIQNPVLRQDTQIPELRTDPRKYQNPEPFLNFYYKRKDEVANSNLLEDIVNKAWS